MFNYLVKAVSVNIFNCCMFTFAQPLEQDQDSLIVIFYTCVDAQSVLYSAAAGQKADREWL